MNTMKTGKPNKKKLAAIEKNGKFKADEEDESNKETQITMGSAAPTKQKVSTKRKASISLRFIYSDSDDSEDLPLNGNKSAMQSKQPKINKARAGTNKAATVPTRKATNDNKKAKSPLPKKDASDLEDLEDDQEYEVECIVGHKVERGISYFCVRWKGYTQADDTWETENNLACSDLIADYRKMDALHKNKTLQTEKKSNAADKSKRSRGRSTTKSNTRVNDPNKEWAVERIIEYVSDEESGGLYRIRWKGYGAKDDTWEPESNLSCHTLIQKFQNSLKQNVDTKLLRESPKKTERLINETIPRSSIYNRIERSSKRSMAKKRVFYGEE